MIGLTEEDKLFIQFAAIEIIKVTFAKLTADFMSGRDITNGLHSSYNISNEHWDDGWSIYANTYSG